MKHDLKKENLWSAYMDGQLTPAESAEFNAALTSDERERMTAEMRLEATLTGFLADSEECPEAVWKRTKAELKRRGKGRSGRRVLLMPYVWKVSAIAAALLVVFLVLRNSGHAPHEDILSVPSSVKALSSGSEVRATLKDVSQFLLDRDVDISLKLVSSIGSAGGHERTLLGARESECEGEKVIEVFYECCGEPLKIVIVEKGTIMAARIRRAVAGGSVQALRVVGDFQVALVGSHDAKNLLDLFVRT